MRKLVDYELCKNKAQDRGRTIIRLKKELAKAQEKPTILGLELKDLLLTAIPALSAALQYWHLNGEKQQVASTMESLKAAIAKLPEDSKIEFEKMLASNFKNDK